MAMRSPKKAATQLQEDEEQEVRPKEIDWKVANEIVYATLARTIKTWDHSVTPSAMALAQAEGALCNFNRGEPAEEMIYDELLHPNTKWKLVLANMYWRSFRQAAMWHIFLKLLQKGLVNTTCLELPVSLHNSSAQTGYISWLMRCFEVIFMDPFYIMLRRIPGQKVPWTRDTKWLATMIVRSGSDLDEVLKEISQSAILGQMCQSRYKGYTKKWPGVQIRHDPKDSEGRMNPDGSVAANDNIFAFWLPHGLTNDPEVRSARLKRSSERAWAIEKAFLEVATPPLGMSILDIRLLHLGNEGTSEEGPPDLEHDVALHDHSATD